MKKNNSVVPLGQATKEFQERKNKLIIKTKRKIEILNVLYKNIPFLIKFQLAYDDLYLDEESLENCIGFFRALLDKAIDDAELQLWDIKKI